MAPSHGGAYATEEVVPTPSDLVPGATTFEVDAAVGAAVQRGRVGVMVATYLKRWVGSRVLSRTTRKGGLNLSKMRVFPRQVSMPLRRDGLDPVPELGEVREVEPVHTLANLFGLDIWLVSGHAEAKQVLADTTSFSNDIRPDDRHGPGQPPSRSAASASPTRRTTPGCASSSPPSSPCAGWPGCSRRSRRSSTDQLDPMEAIGPGRRPRPGLRLQGPLPADLRPARLSRRTGTGSPSSARPASTYPAAEPASSARPPSPASSCSRSSASSARTPATA